VIRILHLQPNQLRAWERVGLIPPADHYSFNDLSRLRILHGLRNKHLSTRKIHASVSAMQRITGVRNPLAEATPLQRGSRLDFRYRGQLFDPITRQLAFDFDAPSRGPLRVIGASDETPPAADTASIPELFLRAVQLEEDPRTLDSAAELYRTILALRPDHAPAAINLGTIHYNRRDFALAEQLYRRATAADPEYALAFFDLGNVLDETLQLDEAISAYQHAVALVPAYADAHYNLALAYERQGERRRALRHWLIYARLDPSGPWSAHAKGQARKILSNERLSIVSRRGRRVPIAG
jgi:tetratricopeptide (TPR) repeat protein